MTAEKGMLPCPGCHTPLPPDATGCQICLRSRTKQEIVRGYAYLRAEEARRKALPFKIAGAALVIAVTAFLSWDNRGKILELASRAKAWTAKKYERFLDANSYVDKKAEPLLPVTVNPADLPRTDPRSPYNPKSRPSDAPALEAFRGISPKPPPAPAAKDAAPEPKGPPAKTDWRVSGSVYDLQTLKPVAEAEVKFLFHGEGPVIVTTDSEGRFEADLAKDDGWTVTLRSPRHKPGQIVDSEVPYRSRDADERRATQQNASDGDLSPAPLSFSRAKSRVRLDLVAVPENWVER